MVSVGDVNTKRCGICTLCAFSVEGIDSRVVEGILLHTSQRTLTAPHPAVIEHQPHSLKVPLSAACQREVLLQCQYISSDSDPFSRESKKDNIVAKYSKFVTSCFCKGFLVKDIHLQIVVQNSREFA